MVMFGRLIGTLLIFHENVGMELQFYLYSPNCLGQETAKGPFCLRVKLPPVYRGGFTLSLFIAECQVRNSQFLVFGLTLPEIGLCFILEVLLQFSCAAFLF